MSARAIVLHAEDNVATALADVSAGDSVNLGSGWELKVTENVPFGHKLAVTFIPTGGKVVKYGECIGLASRDIAAGGYVHVDNVESQRGRGDVTGKRG